MSQHTTMDWQKRNQRYLLAALAEARESLAGLTGQLPADEAGLAQAKEPARPQPLDLADAMSAPPALELLCRTFGLTSFERAILLLAAGAELEPDFADLFALAQADPRRNYLTFDLAMAALPGAHWSALSPANPLRYWRLIEVVGGDTLTTSRLRLDERVLHYLVGNHHLDERLVGLVEPAPPPGELVPSQRALADRLVSVWSQTADGSALPVVQLCGPNLAAKQDIAGVACDVLGLNLYRLSSHLIPANAAELDALLRLWSREAALSSSALLLDCHDNDPTDSVREHNLNRLVEGLISPLVLASSERRPARQRPLLTYDVHKPTHEEQRTVWAEALDEIDMPLNGTVETLVAQFDLDVPAIRAAHVQAISDLSEKEYAPSPELLEAALWASSRMQARPRLSNLVQPIEPIARWDDLVLPQAQKQTLAEVALHVRQRYRVYQTWGFAAKSARGLGISALFTGSSGTGKTMAAEVLANELQLDLYRIDLSQVVSKYIGETEKNLGRIFDAAETGGAILLFDEAEALFGKRSEVKDSHDRYANIEVSYLLQRMEEYRGLAILTTNLKDALDSAFLRRIRFIIRFPFPGPAQRAEIWRRIFPVDTPTGTLDINKLAQLNVTGGNIRNIALNAAFLAAEEPEPVSMAHLLHATRSEYTKLDKSLAEAEIRGWM